MKEINPEKVVQKYPGDLQKQITCLEKKGFSVLRHKEGVAKLEKTKKYKPLLALLLLVLGIIPGLLYTLHYCKYKTHTIVLDIDAQK